MVRTRVVVLALAASLCASAAEAQFGQFSGQLTGHLGVAAAGDVRDPVLTPGFSMAVLDPKGIGVELDIAHTGEVDSARFLESSATSALLNLIVMSPHEKYRPYLVVGAGVLRLKTIDFAGRSAGESEIGWNAGGGLLYMFNDVVGVRGDARYVRHFERHAAFELEGDGPLEFWRTSVGVTVAWTLR